MFSSSVRTVAGLHTVQRNTGEKTRNIKSTACVCGRLMKMNMTCGAAAEWLNSSYLVHSSRPPDQVLLFMFFRTPGIRRSNILRKLGCFLVHARVYVNGHRAVTSARQQTPQLPNHHRWRPAPIQSLDVEQSAPHTRGKPILGRFVAASKFRA